VRQLTSASLHFPQDLDDDWTEGVTAAARAARNELMLTGILQGGDTVVDAARATAMRQLRLLVRIALPCRGSCASTKLYVRESLAHGLGMRDGRLGNSFQVPSSASAFCFRLRSGRCGRRACARTQTLGGKLRLLAEPAVRP